MARKPIDLKLGRRNGRPKDVWRRNIQIEDFLQSILWQEYKALLEHRSSFKNILTPTNHLIWEANDQTLSKELSNGRTLVVCAKQRFHLKAPIT